MTKRNDHARTHQTSDPDAHHFDRTHLWHPYASLPPAYDNILIQRADGVRLYTEDGTALIDGMSSWWASIHGYNHPTLNDALKSQLDDMAHVMFGGLTHTPAIALGRTLLDMVPDGLTGIFYADSGSVAVEVALKTALQYQLAKAQQSDTGNPFIKRTFATTRSGYHGDTWHAMSVCDPKTGMHSLYGGQLPVQYFLPEPPSGFETPVSDQYLSILDDFFATHHQLLAGFIIEPVVQGAGGMRFYNPKIVAHLAALCRRYQVLFIADEIATGFGRTGQMFACQWADVTPDIMTIGKALTGGYLSFGAMLVHGSIVQAIRNSDHPTLMHGPTFMGNPLACAVAHASIKLCQQNDTPRLARQIEYALRTLLAPARSFGAVRDVRCLGAIGVIELDTPVLMPLWQTLMPKYGIWVRPFGKLIYIMPSLIIHEADLITLCTQLLNALDEYLSLIDQKQLS